MEEFRKFEKNTLITMLAFFIPAMIMMLIFVIGQFAPFGSVSVLVADMRYQFVDYIGYMKSVFFGNNDMFYTFSKTFGGDMMGFAAYYLFNPFFLILVLFPNDMLPMGIVIMLIIIMGFMGMSFHIMLRGIWGNRLSSLIFSTAYAMMGFNMAYINCIHYFFSIMMLPLVILGLYRMMMNKRPGLLYIFSAAASVISCYYIGYMILIFTAAFFICFMLSDIVPYADMKERIRNAWTVLYSTLLAVGISAFSLLSVLLSLQGQKKAILKGLMFSRNFSILDFFSGMYQGSFTGNISDGLPIIYSGIISAVFAFFYFANRTIKIREKICALAVFAFLIIGFWIDALNVAWHGFAHPIGFPYRNSFLFSFMTLFIGYAGFIRIKDGFRKRNANILVALFAAYSAYLCLRGNTEIGLKSILITYLSMAVTLILIVAMNEKNRYIVPALAGLFVLQSADSLYNGSVSVDAYFGDKFSHEESMDAYKEYIDSTQEMVDFVNGQDPSFFRMDKLFRRTHNDPMMFSYNGLSHFSSCETDSAKTFMGRMGFRNNGNWAFYGNASTSFADSFMGLKYLMSQHDECYRPYKKIYSKDEKYIYANPYALPLGFGMDETVKYINMIQKDPFKLQNDIAGRFSKTNYQIYRPVKVAEEKLYNLTREDNVYTKTDPDSEAYIEYVLSVTSDNLMYMYFDAPEGQHAKLYINGNDMGEYFSDYEWSVLEGGYFKPGETASIKLVLEDDSLEIDNAYFYYESRQVLKAWYKDAAGSACSISEITSSHLTADVDVKGQADFIIFTIPYEDDWTVKLDGRKVRPVKVMDALLAVKAPPGEHSIDLRYYPKGLIIGTPISVISLLVSLLMVFRPGRKKDHADRNRKAIGRTGREAA
ncbi:MAG: YfhO family protein [Lachnospiraceae bacterium]|nr:YfhO family protein [Lachnospiraceae bacterium]